jgi:hypothetical protein
MNWFTGQSSLVVAAFAMSLFTGSDLNAAPRQVEVKGAYVHEPTGRRFPEQVGDFKHERGLQYDDAGRDISVGYNLETIHRVIAATMYVYPLIGQSFSDELNEVQRAHANVKVAFEQELTLERESKRQTCRMAGLSYEEIFAHRYGPVTSYLLVCDDLPWRVKWRFTHLPTSDKDINQVMKQLATALTVRE